MKSKTKKPKVSPPSLFQVGDPVATVQSKYSHIPVHLVGYIDGLVENGYAVFYRRSVHIGLFGGGGFRKPSIVWMEDINLRKFLPSERQLKMLSEMVRASDGILSLTRAKTLFSEPDDAIKGIRLEYELDDLWDAGLVICRGDLDRDENDEYKYGITDRGINFIAQLR